MLMPIETRDLTQAVEVALRRLGVPDDAPLVAAVSGGPDSVALLHCIAQVETLQKRTVVGHVDHGLRPESAEEASFVAELCLSLKIPFHTTRLNIDMAAAGNLSARLRDARYAFLLGLVAPNGFLLTAHHADDQAVTMLMRLVEGASLPGLAGMRQRRENIVRPLLEVPRRDLITYLREHNITYCQDPSNLDETKFRNQVREQMWNPLLTDDPFAGTRLALAANRLREDDDALQQWAERFLTQARGAANWVEIPLGSGGIAENGVPPAVLRRVLNSVLSVRWNCGPLSGEQWPMIERDVRTGVRTNLPGRITVQMTANTLVFLSQQPVLEYQLDIREPGDYVLPVGVLHVGNGKAPFQVRNLQPGDQFYRSSSKEPTGVQDWLKKLGVPRHKRAGWPVVPLGNGAAEPVSPSSSDAVDGDSPLRFKSELSEGIQGLKELAQKL